jgi:hypothetical protein
MSLEILTQLQYSKDLRGPFALYVYDADGYHGGKQWFAKVIKYPDETISIAEAKARARAAEDDGREVRICDGGDMLVYHSQNGIQLYPPDGFHFWKAIEGDAK